MTPQVRVVLSGSTGLIGAKVLEKLSSLTTCQMIGLGRLQVSAAKKKEFWSGVSVYISCLGTTRAKAGSLEAFRQVDFDLNLELARAAKQGGVRRLILVSAAGADENSVVAYSKIKGELENAIQRLGFDSVLILRPSLLLGRRNESRWLESLGQKLLGACRMDRIGFLRRWAPVAAAQVAKVICDKAFVDASGVVVLENQDLL